MFRVSDHATVSGIASAAVQAGAQYTAPGRVAWDLAAKCQDPQPVHLEGVGRVKEAAFLRVPGIAPFVEMTVRCRKCEACLRFRASVWRNRAIAETAHAPRTWFLTLTLNPDNRWRVDYLASKRCPEFSAPEKQFRLRHSVISAELTKYLKRVRKESGAPLRYCLVAEAHKDGFPHYHLLVHETDLEKPVRHAVLSKQWSMGYSNVKLVDDPRAAYYVAKYLNKSSDARVRASLDYGNYVYPQRELGEVPNVKKTSATF